VYKRGRLDFEAAAVNWVLDLDFALGDCLQLRIVLAERKLEFRGASRSIRVHSETRNELVFVV